MKARLKCFLSFVLAFVITLGSFGTMTLPAKAGPYFDTFDWTNQSINILSGAFRNKDKHLVVGTLDCKVLGRVSKKTGRTVSVVVSTTLKTLDPNVRIEELVADYHGVLIKGGNDLRLVNQFHSVVQNPEAAITNVVRVNVPLARFINSSGWYSNMGGSVRSINHGYGFSVDNFVAGDKIKIFMSPSGQVAKAAASTRLGEYAYTAPAGSENRYFSSVRTNDMTTNDPYIAPLIRKSSFDGSTDLVKVRSALLAFDRSNNPFVECTNGTLDDDDFVGQMLRGKEDASILAARQKLEKLLREGQKVLAGALQTALEIYTFIPSIYIEAGKIGGAALIWVVTGGQAHAY